MRTNKVLLSHGVMLVLCMVYALPVYANDSAFGGSGGSLMPVKHEQVAMRAEDITMEVVKSTATDKRQAPLEWKVDAVYTFENTSKKEVTVQVGFPEFSCGGDSPCPEDHPYSFHGLKTGVRGKPVTHTIGKLSEHAKGWNDELARVHLFNVTFKPEETLTITHTYRHKLSDSVDGAQAHYVTRTGALWAGPIGKARFTVKTPWPTYGVMWPSEFTLSDRHEKVASTTLIKGVTTTWVHVFEMKDWMPSGDLNMLFLSSEFMGRDTCKTPRYFQEKYEELLVARKAAQPKESKSKRVMSVEVALREECFADKSSKALRLLRNTPYAEHGYAFKDRSLRSHFYKPARTTACFRCFDEDGFEDNSVSHHYIQYMVSEHYSPKLLSPAELLYIRLIKAEEKSRKVKKK